MKRNFAQRSKLNIPFSALTIALAASLAQYANASIVDKTESFTSNATTYIDGTVEPGSDSRVAGIASTKEGSATQVDAPDGAVLTVESVENPSASRQYGVVSDSGGSVVINGATDFKITAGSASQIRGYRGNGGNIEINAPTNMVMTNTNEGATAVPVDIWYGSTLNFNKPLTLKSVNTGEGAQTYTVQAMNGTVNFNDKTRIEAEGGTGTVNGLYSSSDAGAPLAVQNFKGDTEIHLKGKGEVIGITPSGASSIVNMSGKNTLIDVQSDAVALGSIIQYGGQFNYDNPQGTLTINAASPQIAVGLENSTYGGSNTVQFGKTKINADTVNINVTANNATGIDNGVADQAVDINQEGDGVYITGKTNLTVKAAGANSQAIGVHASNAQLDASKAAPSAEVNISNLNADVSSDGPAYAVLAEQNSIVSIGGGTIKAHSSSGQEGAIVAQSNAAVNLSGDMTLESSAAILGDATINSTANLDIKGAVDGFGGVFNVNAGNVALNQTTGYFGGTVNVNGGTLDVSELNTDDLSNASTIVKGGTLKAKSSTLFENPLSENGLETDAKSALISADKLKIEGGTLSLTDGKYNTAYSESISKLYSGAKLVFTGQMVSVTGEAANLHTDSWSDNPARTSEKATSGVVYASTPLDATADTNDSLTIGSEAYTPNAKVINASVGVQHIDLADGYSSVHVNGSKELTLVGSTDNAPLIAGSALQAVEVGGSQSTPTEGTLNLGINEAPSGGTLSVPVSVNEQGQINAVNGTFNLSDISNSGQINVKDSANLKVSNLSTSEGSLITVGSDSSTGNLAVENFKHAGSLFLDPTWEGGKAASNAAVKLDSDTLNGDILAGRNSKLVIGETTPDSLDNALKASNHTISQSDLLSAAYIAKPVTLGATGAIVVDGSKSAYEKNANPGVKVASNSALIVNASSGSSLIKAQSPDAQFVTEPGSYVIVDKAALNKDVPVASGFGTISVDPSTKLEATNRLLQVKTVKDSGGEFVLGVTKSDLNLNTLVPNTLDAVMSGAGGLGAQRLSALLDTNNGLSNAEVTNAINRIALMGVGSGANTMAILGSDLTENTIDRHLGALNNSGHKAIGPDLWIAIDGITSRANSYQAGNTHYGYRSELGAVTVGSDYALGNGATYGGSFSFGKGSSRGKGLGVKDRINYYAFNLYSAYNTDYFNTIASVGYMLSENKLTQDSYKAKPKVKVFNASLRFEKPLNITESFTLMPHAGIRYKSVKMDSFRAGGFKYKSDRANIVQIPVGLSVIGKYTTKSSWNIKPFADVSITPALGDRHILQRVGIDNMQGYDSFKARIINNAMYNGEVGLNVNKGAHDFSLHYGLGASNHHRLDQMLMAEYRYRF